MDGWMERNGTTWKCMWAKRALNASGLTVGSRRFGQTKTEKKRNKRECIQSQITHSTYQIRRSVENKEYCLLRPQLLLLLLKSA
jgi:hypothetical protein